MSFDFKPGIILVKKKEVLDLPSLARLVLKSIFEEENMSKDEWDWMQKSIVRWKQHCDLTGDEDIREILVTMAKKLQKNAEGGYDRRKRLFREHKIDWKKAEGVPGAITPKDIAEGQKIYEEYKREHPDTEINHKIGA